jgi:hypothetical protein
VDRDLFVQKYQEMHRLSGEPDGPVTLYIGAENWPFPIPLIKENGTWRFDSDAGKKEVLFRRIGENELVAITGPGGFTVVAYPAEYRSSGVMTFIVREKGFVYEKDLGANTAALASTMAAFHKNAAWRAAEE